MPLHTSDALISVAATPIFMAAEIHFDCSAMEAMGSCFPGHMGLKKLASPRKELITLKGAPVSVTAAIRRKLHHLVWQPEELMLTGPTEL